MTAEIFACAVVIMATLVASIALVRELFALRELLSAMRRVNEKLVADLERAKRERKAQ